jgi:hypothetical protein
MRAERHSDFSFWHIAAMRQPIDIAPGIESIADEG